MKVSVLSAVHNEERYLLDMVDSVRAQTHEEWELLLVDDGSTDATGDKIAQAVALDHRVKSVGDGTKRGKAGAFNDAYAACTGDVVVLLGGDDLLPPDSLRVRMTALEPFGRDTPAAGCFKLVTLSESPRHDGVVLPKGPFTSRSGGVISMTRALADQVFPVDESLPSEDIWIAELLPALSREMVEVPEVVLHYRIHAGNSNPRGRPYAQMTESMAARHRAWQQLLVNPRFTFADDRRRRLETLVEMEHLRHSGRTMALLAHRGLPVVDRLGFAAMSNRGLYAARSRFFRLLSGLRRQ